MALKSSYANGTGPNVERSARRRRAERGCAGELPGCLRRSRGRTDKQTNKQTTESQSSPLREKDGTEAKERAAPAELLQLQRKGRERKGREVK